MGDGRKGMEGQDLGGRKGDDALPIHHFHLIIQVESEVHKCLQVLCFSIPGKNEAREKKKKKRVLKLEQIFCTCVLTKRNHE